MVENNKMNGGQVEEQIQVLHKKLQWFMMESKRQWWKHTKWNEHLNTQMETLMVTIKTFISGQALEK